MEYIKDFDRWNNVKKRLDDYRQRPFFYEKEIWWCNLGINIGSEQDGEGGKFLRPVLIYKKINRRIFLSIPLTKVLKDDNQHMVFYFEYDLHTLIISQLKIIDSKRLFKKMGSISDYLYLKTKKAVTCFLS